MESTEPKKKQLLVPFEQMEVAKLLAWFCSPTQIAKHIEQRFKKKITAQNVEWYKNSEKWQPVIEKLREDYNRCVLEVPLANKRKRLEELQILYNIHMVNEDYKKAQSVLSDFREEMERRGGDINFSFTNVTHNEYQNMTDEELNEERTKTIEQLIRIKRMKYLTNEEKEN